MEKVNQTRFNWLVTFALLLVAAVFLFNLTACGFEVVSTGSRGIKTRFGEVIGKPLPEGLYFYNPFTTGVREYSVRQETWKSKTSIFTKDTQRTDVEFAVTFYPDPEFVTDLFKTVGYESDLVAKIIQPSILGSLKDSIGLVIADELVSKRAVVTKEALHEVQESLKLKHVIVLDLQLTNLDFDEAYEKAVEQKVVATQDALKAKNETVKISEEAKQTILTAQAAAEAMKIKSQALSQNKGLIAYEWVQKWDGKQPQFVMGSNSVPMLDMSKLVKAE